MKRMVGRARPNRPDLAIVAIVLALTGVGLVLVYSASFAIGLNDFGNPNYFVVRQVVGTVAGLALMVLLARMNYEVLRRWSPLILAGALLGLALVLVPGIGHTSNGAARWVRLGPLPPVQPSEFAKLAMVIYIAAWLAAKGEQVKQFSLGVVPFVMMVGLVGGLIMLEPDMGTFLVIALTTGTMFFVAGASIAHVLTLAASGLAGGMVLVAVEGYRMERLLSFLHAEKDPAGKGYQILQLLIALGSGGVRGLGLGESRQKFFYVPGAHTDGIFAIAGEELGFVGAAALIVLFAALTARGFRAAVRARDKFGFLLAVGVTCWIAYQAVINIAGVTRLLPLTGIPLPFLSYGSSAMAATLAAVGVLLSVSRYPREGSYLERQRRARAARAGASSGSGAAAAPPTDGRADRAWRVSSTRRDERPAVPAFLRRER
jgi:cell division protein FtsW